LIFLEGETSSSSVLLFDDGKCKWFKQLKAMKTTRIANAIPIQTCTRLSIVHYHEMLPIFKSLSKPRTMYTGGWKGRTAASRLVNDFAAGIRK